MHRKGTDNFGTLPLSMMSPKLQHEKSNVPEIPRRSYG